MNHDNTLRETVRERTDLLDLVQRDVKMAGGPVEFKGLCPFHKEGTPSFTVNRQKQLFHCFGCGENGDVFAWLMKAHGMDFFTALKTLAHDLGLSVPERRIEERHPAVPEKKRAPLDASQYRALVEGGPVWNYLTQARGLTPETLAAYSVGETVQGDAYAFAYKWRVAKRTDPFTEFLKLVKLDRVGGKKQERRDPAGGRNILFGMMTVPEDATELVICEGEIDAMTWRQYGFPAVSVPGGATYLGWIQICWDWLARFKSLHLSFDEDRAGRSKLVEAVTRLGMARTDIVRLPEREGDVGRYKDANECLQAGVPAEAMRACVAAPEILRPDKLKSIYDFEQDIWEKFHSSGKEAEGLTLPWGNANGSSLPFRFRYGEVTVWTGFNKHGKSEVLNHVVVDLTFRQGEKALIASLEVSAPETYKKLVRMAHATRNPIGPEERDIFKAKCLTPLAERVWVYDQVGNAPLADVLNVMLYAYQRYGVRQFVLDSLMRFDGLDGEGQEIWNSQREFMNRLIEFAQRYRVHVHLVAHSKKPGKQGEREIPRRYDIMGSAYISNLAFNVIVVWRNRAKHDALEEVFGACERKYRADAAREGLKDFKMPPWKRLSGPPPSAANRKLKDVYDLMRLTVSTLPEAEKEYQQWRNERDAYLIVDAQRGGDGDTPVRNLWFHYDSLQFCEQVDMDQAGGMEPVCYAEKYQVREEMDVPL
jgi:twinkle protein